MDPFIIVTNESIFESMVKVLNVSFIPGGFVVVVSMLLFI